MARSRKQKTTDDAPPAQPAPAPGEARLRGPGRGALLVACALLWAIVVFGYAGSAWASVLYRVLVEGSMLALWLACATGLGALVLLALPLGPDTKPGHLLHVVTAAALGLGLFSLATLGLGLAGWLGQATAFGMLGAGGLSGVLVLARGGAFRDRRAASESASAWLRAPAGWEWLWLAAMPFLGLATVAALLPPGVLWPTEPHAYDVVEYHLQIPREWYELGRIVPLRHNAFSFFPFNVEMHYLLAMHLRGGPWAGMYLAHFMHLAMIALTVAAVHGFALRRSRSLAAATIASVAVATVPWMAQLGSIAYNEGGLLLFGTLAIGWAFDAVTAPARRPGRFPVAGLMAGFACGSKLTAVPEVLLAVAGIAVAGILLDVWSKRRVGRGGERQRDKATAGQGDAETASFLPLPPSPLVPLSPAHPAALRLGGVVMFVLAGLLAFAPWLVRNEVWAGNPLFPEAAPLLGQGHFSDAQVERWKQAHSPPANQRSAGARLKAWFDDVWLNWRYGYALLPLGLAAGAAACFARGPADSGGADAQAHARAFAYLTIALFIALCVVWLGFTHLQGRFFILGVPIAAMLLTLLPRGRVVLATVAVVVLVAAVPAFARLHTAFGEKLFDREWRLLLGLVNFDRTFVPKAYDEAMDSGAPLALAGDARAFGYPVPMTRLSYRTVFDVDAHPGESAIDAWVAGAPPNAWRLVDPVELRRFQNTYRGIPPLPPEHADARDPFLLPPRAER